MGSKAELLPNDFIIASGFVFSSDAGFAGVGAGTAVHIGVLTGSLEVLILQRSYGSSESQLTVELFEATFTGGTPARTFNRRLSSTEVQPAIVHAGVTPGALETAITGTTLRAATSGGSASLQVSGDERRIYLKEGTSYVIRMTNGGSGAAVIGTSFDYRKALKGNWEKVVPSA